LNYQWKFNGTNITGATNAILTLTNLQLNSAGSYAVTISSLYGSTNSSNAVLIVQALPVISSQPTNQTVTAGYNANFSATVNGTPPLVYQWRFNGTNISGATNSMLGLTNVQLASAGSYSLRITNAFGSAISSNALLTVQAPPIFNTQPTNLTVNVGVTAVFAVTVTGSSPLNYQWSFNGTNNSIPGATNAALTISNAQLANAGVYAVTVTNLFGLAVSSNATLTVNDVLDHFSWNLVPSPRFVNAPFNVSIQAMDSINQLFTNFAGTVLLTTTNGIPASPGASGGFVQGTWTNAITISQPATNLVLQASDGAGHLGLANPINVISPPSLNLQKSGGTFLIFWPVDPAGFVLETSGTLIPAQWTQVSAPPFQIGNQYLESVQINGTNQFYRLRFILP